MKKCVLIIMAILLAASPCLSLAAQSEELSVRQMIMRKIMVSVRRWSDTDPAADEERASFAPFTGMNGPVREFFEKYQPGGAILFAQSASDTAMTVNLINDMQSAVTGAGGEAMLISIDQEGGRITRLAHGTSLPGNMAIGATGDAEYARKAGRIIGMELSSLGVNMDCAPSLDVNNNPLNPVINVRSFGESPELVKNMGLAYIEGLESQGVVSVVKHFPGHGDTVTDSHSSLPLVGKTKEQIEKTELAPFKAAVDAGVQVVMTAHIQYPALDDTKVKSASTGEEINLPATLSRKILTGVLRGEMGFDGVIMTDALNMDAIATHFGVGDALVRAFAAGVDMALMPVEIMCPGDIAEFERAVCQVEEAVESGELSLEDLKASVGRITRLKQKNGVLGASPASVGEALSVIASPENREIEREISQKAVTLIKNDGVIPMKPQKGDRMLLIAAYANELTAMRFGIERLIDEGVIPKIELLQYAYTKDEGLTDGLRELIGSADGAILISEIGNASQLHAGDWRSDMPLKIVDALNGKDIPYLALSVFLPQDAALLKGARAIAAVYNPTGMREEAVTDKTVAYGPNIPAAMDVIFGLAAPEGRLPVTVYALDGDRNIDMENALYTAGH